MKIKKINVNLPPKELSNYLKSNDNWVLSIDENFSSTQIRELFNKHIKSPYCSELIIESIAEHLNTPVDILEMLSEKEDWKILDSLSTNPNINLKVINNILKTNNYTVLEHLVYNPSFPREQLIDLFERSHDEDLKQVIGSILEKNIKDDFRLEE